MAISGGGRGQAQSNKDKVMAARLKDQGDERTIGRCAQCYAIISIESRKSRYTHKCRG